MTFNLDNALEKLTVEQLINNPDVPYEDVLKEIAAIPLHGERGSSLL